MAASLVKVAGKLTVGGFALYGLSEVLSSQENTIKQLSVLDSKTRENIPFSLPEVMKKLRPGSDAEPKHWIKYMKSSAFESIRNAFFNLERLSRSFSPLERLWTEPNA